MEKWEIYLGPCDFACSVTEKHWNRKPFCYCISVSPWENLSLLRSQFSCLKNEVSQGPSVTYILCPQFSLGKRFGERELAIYAAHS